MSLTTETVCNGFADLTGSGSGYGLGASVYKFTDGSAMNNCRVSGGNTESAETAMYRAGQPGATNGACLVRFDIEADHTGGYWTYAVSGLTAVAMYHDPGSTWDGHTWPLTCTSS